MQSPGLLTDPEDLLRAGHDTMNACCEWDAAQFRVLMANCSNLENCRIDLISDTFVASPPEAAETKEGGHLSHEIEWCTEPRFGTRFSRAPISSALASVRNCICGE